MQVRRNNTTTRSRFRSVRVALGLGAGLWLAGLSVSAAPAHADAISDEATFVRMVNDLRISRNLAPLRIDDELTRVARAWATRMAQTSELAHNPNLVSDVKSNWVKVGENVGTGGDVEAIERAFENSPAHLRNLVDPSYDSIGIGVVVVGDTIWVTQNFQDLPDAPVRSAPKPVVSDASAPIVVQALVKSPVAANLVRPPARAAKAAKPARAAKPAAKPRPAAGATPAPRPAEAPRVETPKPNPAIVFVSG